MIESVGTRDFLFESRETRGFIPTWINWIENLVKKGYVGAHKFIE